jgi:hypothetical protein
MGFLGWVKECGCWRLDIAGLKFQNVALYPWLLSSVKGDVIVLSECGANNL